MFLVSSTIAGIYIIPQYKAMQELKERNEATRLEKEKNIELMDKKQILIQDLEKKPEAIERIARDKFGYCLPGERVYKFTDENLFDKKSAN